MCGLAGIIVWDEAHRVDRAMLQRMSACIAHRGPDACGVRLRDDSGITAATLQVGLVHQRLAIIDLDHRADQPFTDHRGRWMVFNGEIYNHRELRAQISGVLPDYPWRTTCDTEVLLAAYEAWGESCLEHLNGMYAFAIWDPHADGGRLFLARDRMGQKPLYHAHIPGRAFAFASEPAALLQLPWVDRSIDSQAISDYLMWGCAPRGTIYAGIGKLMPGTCMMARATGIKARSYFDPNPSPADQHPASPESAIARTRELVTRAVQRQLVADVPLGCFLSGGIDSSIIAACMRRVVPAGQPVLTFSIGFDDPRYDETKYAAAVARRIGTQHHQFIVTPNAADDLPKLAAMFGEPFGDSSALPTHYLSRETRQHVKVALSGDGGDELFGGYDRYRAMALAQRIHNWPGAVLAARLAGRLPGAHPKSHLARLKRLAATLHLSPARRYAGYLGIFNTEGVARLLGTGGDEPLASERLLADRYERLTASRDVVQAALAADRELYLPEDLLMKVDRCSMLHALEVRSPFMDHELVHFAASLPTDLLIRGGGKRLLREAFAGDLPAEVFNRPKMGFAVPIGEWFRNSLRPMLHDTLLANDSFAAGRFDMKVVRELISDHECGQMDHSQRLYVLLMLELWWNAVGRVKE